MLQGDTIQLRVNFKGFNGQEIDPLDVKLTIYDNDEQQVEQFILDDTNKENVGVYFYNYVPTNDMTAFIYEFSGTYNSKPVLAREKLEIKFI